MNCDELTGTLETTLLRDRDPRWLDEARRHAKTCPACTRLLELARVEERLTTLSAVEPSSQLLETVMHRVRNRKPARHRSSRGFSLAGLRYAAIIASGLLLAGAYMVPPEGQSWLSNLGYGPGFMRSVGISAYLSHHPLWAIGLAGFAALVIVLGLELPERPRLREAV